MLGASRKFLKVVGATAAFAVILRAQATTSLTQKKEFHMEIKRNGSQPSGKGPADWCELNGEELFFTHVHLHGGPAPHLS